VAFKFIKDLGEKLGEAGITSEHDVAASLVKRVKELELDIDDLTITYEGGTATVSGTAADDDTREKAILAVGNTEGVGEVDDKLVVGTTDEEKAEAEQRRADAIKRAKKMRKQLDKRRKKAAKVAQEAQEAAKSLFYTVESGDTLWKIADEHYGDGSKYPTIFEANTPMLKNPDLIYPGQVLRIPALEDDE
jgi:nucleoid-associated protein YgaU